MSVALKKQAVAPAVTVHQYMPQEKCGLNRLCTPSHAYAAVHRASNKIPTLLLPGEHFWDGMLMLASIASRKATPENPLESSPTSYTDKASEERKGMMNH
jgi:hypothetical protein